MTTCFTCMNQAWAQVQPTTATAAAATTTNTITTTNTTTHMNLEIITCLHLSLVGCTCTDTFWLWDAEDSQQQKTGTRTATASLCRPYSFCQLINLEQGEDAPTDDSPRFATITDTHWKQTDRVQLHSGTAHAGDLCTTKTLAGLPNSCASSTARTRNLVLTALLPHIPAVQTPYPCPTSSTPPPAPSPPQCHSSEPWSFNAPAAVAGDAQCSRHHRWWRSPRQCPRSTAA